MNRPAFRRSAPIAAKRLIGISYVLVLLNITAGAAAPGAPLTAIAAPAPSPLIHLPATADGMRVTGEDGILTWPVYLPAASVSGNQRFQLSYTSAISVMPEASRMTLAINGHTVGRVPIAAPTQAKVLSFDIPAGTLSAGWNAVELSVSQRHRVDCSVAAAYELWTQLDPAQTGFIGRPPTPTSVDDLPVLAATAVGATPIHLILLENPAPADLSRAMRVAERVALRGHFNHPVVDAQPAATGLHIAVGTTASGASLIKAGAKEVEMPIRLTTMPNGAPLLVVSAPTEEELDRVIDEFGASVPVPAGTPEGLRALRAMQGMRFNSGETMSFADLGLRSRTFSGRLFQEDVDVTLPADAYLADYGDARLSLDGGYAAGLTRDARLTVRVNGIIDGDLSLDRPDGTVLRGQMVYMPLRAFRRGRNHVQIEVQLPARTDEACDTLSSTNAKERFLLLGTSTFSLPRLARIARFPSVAAAFAGNFRVTPSAAPRVFIPHPTAGAIGAAGTLLSNAAVRTGVPTNAVILAGAPSTGETSAVVIGTSADQTPTLLAAAGIDQESIATAWKPGVVPMKADSSGPANADEPLAGRTDTEQLDAWGQRVDASGGHESIGAFLPWIKSLAVRSFRSAGLLPAPDRPLAVAADTSFVLAQGMDEDTAIMLVTAPDDAALTAGASSLTDPAHLNALHGRAVLLTGANARATTVPVRDVTFFQTQPFSISNSRLIAGAWLSSNAGWYIGAALLMSVVLGASTALSLSSSRRNS